MDAISQKDDYARPSVRNAGASQSASNCYRVTLEPSTASCALGLLETSEIDQAQSASVRHSFPDARFSSPVTATLDHAQSVGSPLEALDFASLPKIQDEEASHLSSPSLCRTPRLISSSDSIQAADDVQPQDQSHMAHIHNPLAHDAHRLRGFIDDFSVPAPELMSSSSDRDTSNITLSSDDPRQSMEVMAHLPISTATICFSVSDENIQNPQPRNPVLTSLFLRQAEEFHHKESSMQREVTLNPASSETYHPDLDPNQANLADPQSNAATFSSAGSLTKDGQSVTRSPDFISSSPGVSMPRHDLQYNNQDYLAGSTTKAVAFSSDHHVVENYAFSQWPHQAEAHVSPRFSSLCGAPEQDPQLIKNTLPEFPAIVSSLQAPEPAATPENSDEEPDITPLEYARQNGLSRNYLDEPNGTSNFKALPEFQTSFIDDSHLPSFDLTAVINSEERLTISKEAALLISCVAREEIPEWYDDTVTGLIHTSRYRIPRLELPLLKTDNDSDLRKFAKRDGFEAKLEDIKLPLEIIEEEHGGWFGINPSLLNKGAEILETVKKERLEVSRDTLLYLQDISRADWTKEEESKVWASTRTYKKTRALEPVTPPLSPLAFPPRLHEPSMSDPVFELPILSDPESLTRQDLEDLEKKLFDQDAPTPIKEARPKAHASSETLIGSDAFSLADVYSPAASLYESPISPVIERKRFKREDLKVEEPIFPDDPAELPKFFHCSDTALNWPVYTRSSPANPMESGYFEDTFEDALVKANRMSEQESLITADTTARVKVPVMDFSLPVPPWEAFTNRPRSTSLLSAQKCMMKSVCGEGLPRWLGLSKVKVRYNPFPHDLAKVALDERYEEDDSLWRATISAPGDDAVIDTSTLIWKPPGLKILKDEEDDDEVEHGQFDRSSPQDLSVLAKKRRMEIDERDNDEIGTSNLRLESPRQPPRKKTPKPTEFTPPARNPHKNLIAVGGSLLMGGAFSVGDSVDNFLEMRGTKMPVLSDSSYFAKSSRLTESQPPANPNLMPEMHTQTPLGDSPVLKARSPLPTPTSKIPTTPVNIIVATPFLKHRSLIKHIESLFPDIILVERDFSAHDTAAWMPGSVTRSPITSPLASEADIIVSPLVGVILTTLQKIKQKPLPGQRAQTAIRERLEQVCPRYEKLFILVTEKREDSTHGLDESDCSAISEFVGFSLGLATSVDVQFVGGGEPTLARWLMNVIVQHKVDEELLTDETHWELFLRRAGLNAFAAQHIIVALKASDSMGVPSPSKAAHYGLTGLVEMGREQRIARFGAACGTRTMARVSAVIDRRWS